MASRPRSVMERAYTAIKAQIMVLDLAPGSPVDDIQVGDELGISRTPVREALFRLASEGLVVTGAGQSGFFVRPLDLLDLSSLFEAHMVVARATARLVATRATAEDLAALRRAETETSAAIERGGAAEVAASNAALHRLEADASHNGYLAGLARSIHDQGQRLGYLAFGETVAGQPMHVHLGKVQDDHRALVDAYEAGDPDEAERIAAQHVLLFRERIIDFMKRSVLDPVDLGGDVLPSLRITRADLE